MRMKEYRTMEYSGTFENLQNMIHKCGYQIKETKALLNASKRLAHQIKTSDGGVINWYESTGKLSFQGKDQAAKKLQEDLTSYLEEIPTTPSPKIASNVLQAPSKKIFIAHGHDCSSLRELESILLKLELKPYVLQNTGGNGLPIIETLKKEICNDSIGFSIVLLTPDDMGYAKSDKKKIAHPRARQNVILEMGMLIATLPLERIAILQQKGVERPSNIGGVYYLSFNKHVKETVPQLADRLIGAGFSLDAKQLALASR